MFATTPFAHFCVFYLASHRVTVEERPDIEFQALAIRLEAIATGEYWLASQAKEKGLVDEIMTSDDYLCSKLDDCEIIEIKTEIEQNRIEKLIEGGVYLFKQWTASRIPGVGQEMEDLRERFR